jgi:hypothetical protein
VVPGDLVANPEKLVSHLGLELTGKAMPILFEGMASGRNLT